MKIGCIVLAAGKSIRFGNLDKLLQPLGGRPLLLCTLSALPIHLFDAFCTVTSSDSISKLCLLHGYSCRKYDGGLLSDSIREGFYDMPDDLDGYLFVNGDRPFLKKATILRMMNAFNENPDSIIRLCYHQIPSNPVLFPASAKKDLLTLQGDQGGGQLIKSGKYGIISIEATSENEVVDVDNQAMLVQANLILQSISEKE